MINLLVNYGLVDLDNFDTEDIDTVSIAKALSRLVRFGGNFDSMSVAQHALCVAELVKSFGGTAAQQMAALHHDDAEAFLGDVPSPIKMHCEGYIDMEGVIMEVIESKYGVTLDDPLVSECDAIVGMRELNFHLDRNPLMPRLMIKLPERYGVYGMSQQVLTNWGPDLTLARYLERHDKLELMMHEEAESRILVSNEPDEEEEDDTCLN